MAQRVTKRPFWVRTQVTLGRLLFSVALVCSVFACSPSLAQAVFQRTITAADVQRSIESAVAFIKSQQQADGSWTDRPEYGGGLTPLCTLALLHGGCTVDDDAVARALRYLRGFRANATYATSLQTMVFCAA